MEGLLWMSALFVRKLPLMWGLLPQSSLGQLRVMCASNVGGSIRREGAGRWVLCFNQWCLRAWAGCLLRQMGLSGA
eukprot:3063440-Karenia_brevis.AAC.1